ncbi:hypothetical protein BD413DRAFT_43722 [Trametes elegans]|nr:hypothetical protein BD413DRAFT_43722 [Trametes elegans]
MPSRTSDERNIVLVDYHGAVLAGFHQYGAVTWKTFFKWLNLLIDTTDPWIIVRMDERHNASERYFPIPAIVMPGEYTLLAADRTPLHVNLTNDHARRPQPTYPTDRNDDLGSLHHARARDLECLASGRGLVWHALQVAHTFSPNSVCISGSRG